MKTTLSLAILLVVSLIGNSAAAAVLWTIGSNNDSTTDFESESGGDDLFYKHAGDYTGTYGYDTTLGTYTLPGANRATAEALIDAGSATEGFERAMTTSDRAINVYFQLGSQDVVPGARYRFDLEYDGQSGDGHDVTYAMNGQVFATTTGIALGGGRRTVRPEFDAAAVNAAVGSNVLSILKTDSVATWLTIDHLRLSRIEPREIFAIGFNDDTQSEFDSEGGSADDKFYWEPGDYTSVQGFTGLGANVAAPEEYRVGGSQGFPRAVTSGVSATDIFFQLDRQEAGFGKFRFQTDLISLGSGSSHNLEFLLNGEVFHSESNVTANRAIDLTFLSDNVWEGGNVLTLRRNGGGTTNAWIQFDFVNLTSVVPEPSSVVLALSGLLLLGVAGWRRRRAA